MKQHIQWTLSGAPISINDEQVSNPSASDMKPNLNCTLSDQLGVVVSTSSSTDEMIDDGSNGLVDAKTEPSVVKTPIAKRGLSPSTVDTRGGGAPPFRPSDPALCGSRPLVTPYYCRLGDLLCYSCTLYLSTIFCVYAYL